MLYLIFFYFSFGKLQQHARGRLGVHEGYACSARSVTGGVIYHAEALFLHFGYGSLYIGNADGNMLYAGALLFYELGYGAILGGAFKQLQLAVSARIELHAHLLLLNFLYAGALKAERLIKRPHFVKAVYRYTYMVDPEWFHTVPSFLCVKAEYIYAIILHYFSSFGYTYPTCRFFNRWDMVILLVKQLVCKPEAGFRALHVLFYEAGGTAP